MCVGGLSAGSLPGRSFLLFWSDDGGSDGYFLTSRAQIRSCDSARSSVQGSMTRSLPLRHPGNCFSTPGIFFLAHKKTGWDSVLFAAASWPEFT